MSKIARKTMLQFGSAAGASQIAQFGSFAAGTPAFTTDPAVIQSLSNYLQGMFGAVMGSESPAIEDHNAIFYLDSYQLCYLFQQGVAEWDGGTTYYIGSLVQDGSGNIYVSLANNNLNNALTSTANWRPLLSRGISPWSAAVSYSIGDLAQDGSGNVYISQINSNLNNALTSSTAKWVPQALSGTFTPTITWSNTPTGYTGTWSYVQIGKIVTVTGAINFTSASSGTGITSITIPVPTASLSTTIGGLYANVGGGASSGIVQSNSGSSTTVALSPPMNVPNTDTCTTSFSFSYVVS